MEPSPEQLEALKGDATSLLSRLSVDRPLFVEFAGTPKSGKSTCIDSVQHFFKRVGYKVLAPTEGASKRTPYYLKQNWVCFNAWSATYALTHILEGKYGSDQYHIAILDRGLFDALAWFELLKASGDISNLDCETIQNFLLIEHWQGMIDVVFLFETDPETSMIRENRDQLIDEPGQAMNEATLSQLNGAYSTVREKYADRFSTFQTVNTSGDQHTSPLSTSYEVTNQILKLLQASQTGSL